MNANLLFTIIMILAGFSFLAMSDPADSLDITKVVEGTVKATKANTIDVLDDSKSKDTRIAIDSNTVYDNVQKLSDLKIGDKVQVEYQTVHNKDIAITITKMEVEG